MYIQPGHTWNAAGTRRRPSAMIGFMASRSKSPRRFSETHIIIVTENHFIVEEGERRYQAIGMSGGLVLLLVVFVERGGPDEETIHIISARKATDYEKSAYEDQFHRQAAQDRLTELGRSTSSGTGAWTMTRTPQCCRPRFGRTRPSASTTGRSRPRYRCESAATFWLGLSQEGPDISAESTASCASGWSRRCLRPLAGSSLGRNARYSDRLGRVRSSLGLEAACCVFIRAERS